MTTTTAHPYLNEHAQTWLAGLRSDVFIKGTGHLNRNGCHCTLGVAQELVGDPNTPVIHGNPTATKYREQATQYWCEEREDWTCHSLPQATADKLGLYTRSGEICPAGRYYETGYNSIWSRNDAETNFSLSNMADWIEKYAKFLFVPVAEQGQPT